MSSSRDRMGKHRKLCDMGVALQRMGNNAQFLREVIEMVRKDLPDILNRLHAAVADKNAALLAQRPTACGERWSHSMRRSHFLLPSVSKRSPHRAICPAARTMDRVDREVARLDAVLVAELKKA